LIAKGEGNENNNSGNDVGVGGIADCFIFRKRHLKQTMNAPAGLQWKRITLIRQRETS
jgi:hypothetical protein